MALKIARAELQPLTMTKEDPEWAFALGASPVSEGLVLKLTSEDGIVGLGYGSSAAHWGGSFGGIKDVMEQFCEILEGKDAFDREAIQHEMDKHVKGNNSAKCAVDIALYDLQAKALGVPVSSLLGGVLREEVPVMRIVALKEPMEMAKNAYRLVEQDYQYLKIKVGTDPVKDVQRVKEIRNAVGDDIHCTVDVNQQYTAKTAIATLRKMQQYGIDTAEQPVRMDNVEGLRLVRENVECRVEAHEAVTGLEALSNLIRVGAMDQINLTPGEFGGLTNSKHAAAMCHAANVYVRFAAIGSRILASAAMHAIASIPNIDYACEIGEFSRFVNDAVTGFEIEHGKARVPKGPGLGVELVN